MPQPQPRQAMFAAGVSVLPSLARNSLARLKSARAWCRRALEGVPECCSGARARRERRHHCNTGATGGDHQERAMPQP